jgi:hypothetical protein
MDSEEARFDPERVLERKAVFWRQGRLGVGHHTTVNSMEYVYALIISILGNLVMPAVQKVIAGLRRLFQRLRSGPEAISEPVVITEQLREQNRRRLRRTFDKVSLNANCVLILACVLWLPLSLKTLPGRVLGSSPSRVDSMLPEISQALVEAPFLSSLLATAVLFLPMMLLSRLIAKGVATRLARFYEVKERRVDALAALSFFMLSVVLACHLVYVLFAGLSYLSCVVAPLVLLTLFLISHLGQFGRAAR